LNAELVAHQRSPESGNYYPNKDALLESYKALVDQIKETLPLYFAKFPRSPLEVVEKDVASAPAAYYMQVTKPQIPTPYGDKIYIVFSTHTIVQDIHPYMQGTADGQRPGRFYVNVSNLHQRPKYEMTALALHEGVPGHHLQGSLASSQKSAHSRSLSPL
jgi:uncharacterized protein (DUF885 family)